jgi:hypothetical protein
MSEERATGTDIVQLALAVLAEEVKAWNKSATTFPGAGPPPTSSPQEEP